MNSLPIIFKAKKAGLFLIDHNDPKFMYTITGVGADENGTKYIQSIVKYSSNYGYTGHSITQK